MSRRHKGRPVDGIFLLDKPQGVSSNYVLQGVKRIYGAAKAGHTGALDPLATGMLPLTFGEATKFSQFLLNANKRYQTTAKLGVRTDSSDADGQVVATADVGSHVTQELIQSLLDEHFTGEIEQVPSMFSALKHNGQPLYKLARQGITVEVKPRKITIFSITIIGFRGDELDLDISCSKGTYIRSIVEDLGLYLGCGAHVKALRRLDSGPYKAESMITLEELQAMAAPAVPDEPLESIQKRLDALLLVPWSAIEDTPVIELASDQCALVRNGIVIDLNMAAQPLVRIQEKGTGDFLGIGEITPEGRLVSRRLMSTNNQSS
ncbi:tRNA pseudouridine(55) synthase TruB [Neptunomonas antarctica]|uniref:tRNA pseudouridine synthase B n=1 Tax=Neptunomonas antarctica TaxID=619304 RepID=A0A1N7PLS6_9GAMM|nr:tRNA pseudouridine(55) synthase TruB [Neptunomonas antarctica]SIT11329.1 tRNA pseudouridine synthase B [Neptunomonas antarctica]